MWNAAVRMSGEYVVPSQKRVFWLWTVADIKTGKDEKYVLNVLNRS